VEGVQETRGPGVVIGVAAAWRARRAAPREARAQRGPGVSAPDLHPCGDAGGDPPHRPASGGLSFPEIEKSRQAATARAEGATAFVSIMEGCSKVLHLLRGAYTRGEERERPFDDVLAEVAELAAQGVKEITLLDRT